MIVRRKCKICKSEFIPRGVAHWMCSDKCRKIRNKYTQSKAGLAERKARMAKRKERSERWNL